MQTPHPEVRHPSTRTALFILTLALTLGCGSPEGTEDGPDAGGGGDGTDAGQTANAPEVESTSPLAAATDVALNAPITAHFSQDLSPVSVTAATFTVTMGTAQTPVAGVVIYANRRAHFWPAHRLQSNTAYTATVHTGVLNTEGAALAESHGWTFTTGDSVGPGLPVDLGTAGGFVILSKSGVSTVPTSAVTGNIGVSPAAASYITGFSLTVDGTNVFSSSPQVTGQLYAADYAAPTPANLTTAVGDMQLAFTDAAGRSSDFTEHGAGDIGGMTLAPGVYKWGTGVLVPTDVTLNGSATDVWIFQVAQDLTVANGVTVLLSGGALAKNVFWQVAGKVELGTTAHMEGVLLSQTSITLQTGASLNGRMLAQTAVDLDGSTVVQPAP